jgi:ATPase subunit of ABC transporter with duplicated ATPase domains
MAANDVILRFEDVCFEHGPKHPILSGVSFSVRRGSKITLMGQNGAGKSTIFGLITGARKQDSGDIHIAHGLSIAMARQVIPRKDLGGSVRDFFAGCFPKKVYDLDPRIEAALEAVNLAAPLDRTVKSFSGGQQARLLLASALIQDPDLLLLDEPTNNLDAAGIGHLTEYLRASQKTCIVISHDADFLNAFSDGVLYLDAFTKTVEQYVGNYHDTVKEISARVEKEERANARLNKEIQANKDKANFFANKGGRMRLLARRMRDKAEELEEDKVDVRREDKTIRPFQIKVQEDLSGEVFSLSTYSVMKGGKSVSRSATVSLRRNRHLLLRGPNGIGKSTLLEAIATGSAPGSTIAPGVRVGYYRQDFSTLDFEATVHASLFEAVRHRSDTQTKEEELRSVASGFLIGASLMGSKVGDLSEGQKGLLAFARLALERPGLLILDEPTNHINFRHIPVIAKALDAYEGAMILVSHVPDFVKQVRIDEILDLER